MARLPIDATAGDQANAVVSVVEKVLDDSVVAIYLYGSAVVGGLRPASDLDLFAVVSRPTTDSQRRDLVEHLVPISRRGMRPQEWRPVELTVVAESEIKPWRYPPRTDFQYGEWLRDRFDAGEVDPEHPNNPDIAVLIEMVRRNGKPLRGPSASDLLPVVPGADLESALIEVVPDLLAEVDTDTANVLLTLARILHTLETGQFASKDEAADGAIGQIGSTLTGPLAKARDVYLGTDDDWSADLAQARATARLLESRIRQHAQP